MTYYEPLHYRVRQEEDGWILKTILQRRMLISRKLLARLKQTDCGITVNGERKYTNIRVSAGDMVEIRMEQESSEDIMPQDLPFEIVYEDDHLLVVNKPAGMIVHPTHGHYTHTLANAVVYYWNQRGKQHRFRPVHRLDQETSGVLAVAKNPYAHQHISGQMKRNQVDKEYLAVVYGTPPEADTIDAPIDRDLVEPHMRVVTPDGYRAVTHYRTICQSEGAALVRLKLETGRTHQIRVHMQHIGCPLIGDKLYFDTKFAVTADKFAGLIARHALHAVKLGFQHPITGDNMEFTAALPEDMRNLLQVLHIPVPHL